LPKDIANEGERCARWGSVWDGESKLR
jgi:hypothetical protein